jgi:DNA repair protein RadD
MILRPYQEQAVAAALSFLRTSTDPVLIDAAPAAGKSFMIAAIADALHGISGGKKVLCLAPSAELVTQNHGKFLLTGEKASIFSSSAGSKSTRHHVVFATPMTVKNAISRFSNPDEFCAVIVDECHGLTPTIRSIIETMREKNPRLRVLGLSGTPFNLGKGYIFRQWPDGKVNDDTKSRDPYFTKSVYRVSAREMLDAGFITPMIVGAIHAAEYDTSGIRLLPNGHLDDATVERAFEGHGRKTAAIIADVLAQAQSRRGGVMYFAATRQHAGEIMASLPQNGTAAMVTGDMKAAERKRIIAAYRRREVRHLVSIGTLTTGFDVEHTETIAILRYTESAALLQQILGRAWRLSDNKPDSLLLDYAGNVERHFPDGDIYNPTIKAGSVTEGAGAVEAQCPQCGHDNQFTRHKDAEGYELDVNGYCVDVFGARVETDFGPMSGHYGRRCWGMVKTGPSYERCGYRWTGKDCLHCAEKNDIAARYCFSCKGEIVDPNEKLAADFKAMKRDPTTPQTDEVLSMEVKEGVSQRGNRTVRADWKTPYRQFSIWYTPESQSRKAQDQWARFAAATANGEVAPKTISYVKEAESSFYRPLAYDMEADAI